MGGIQSLPHQDTLPPLYVRLDAGACHPERKTEGSAGYDLTALEGGEVSPCGVAKVRTGVYTEIPQGLFGAIKGRSGLASRGILAFEGTVDSDYRGEICVILYNTREKEVFSYTAGQRIAQLVIIPYVAMKVREVPELGLTARGDNGFGSTDTIQIKMHPITRPENGNGLGGDLEASVPHDN